MKITYIYYSSFLAELQRMTLLFDYFEGDIPAIREDAPLLVFASHRHGDHFSPVIFELAKRHPQVYYILSDDIWRKRVPEELRERTWFMGPGETLELSWKEDGGISAAAEGENSLQDGENGREAEKDPEALALRVKTFKSTDEGVAFLLRTEGKTIYHAGDLNHWVWEGEPEDYNRQMRENFRGELKKLAGTHIDLAFMLIDPRQEKDFYLGMDDFMRMVGADTVFPMHFWEDFEAAARFKALPCAAEYKDKIREIHRRGESFLVE